MLTARVVSLFQIRPGEGRLVASVAALFAFLEIGRNIGANAADGLFFIRFGAEFLPYMTIALGTLTLFITLSYTIGLGRFRKGVFFTAVLCAFAVTLVIERAALVFDLPLLYPILWLTVNFISAILGTLVWNVAAEVCDTRQAKRMFSLFTSAGIFGGVLGNLVTGALAKSLGTENLLLLYAALLLLALVLSREIAQSFFKPSAKRTPSVSWLADLRTGLDFVRTSPLMQLIAYSSILFSILYFSVYIPFSQVASASFPNEADLAGFLGLVSSAITIVTLIVALFIANRLYARLGVVNAVLLLPITYFAGFILFAANASLTVAVTVRLAQMVTMNGLASAAWSTFFNVVPPEKRSQVQSFDGGVTSQIGVVLSGVLPILGERVLTTTQIFIAGMVVALGTAYLVWQMRRAYASALVAALRAGLLDVFTATRRGFQYLNADANARRALLAGLTDPQPGRRRISVEILGKMGDRSAIQALCGALGDADIEVRRAALGALVQLEARQAADPLTERLADPAASVRAAAIDALLVLDVPAASHYVAALADPAPRVRARAAVALCRAGDAARARDAFTALLDSNDSAPRAAGLEGLADCPAAVPVQRVTQLLCDPSVAVRTAALKALGACKDRQAHAALVQALDDADGPVRRAAAAALQSSGAALDDIVRVLNTGSERAQQAALTALRGRGPAAQGALVDWVLTQTPRASRYRVWATRLAPAEGDHLPSMAFLRDLLRERERQTVGRILQALALMGTEEALRLIARGLKSKDQEMRAQALEALDTLSDKRIARGLVPLLEDSAAPARPDTLGALRELTAHPDPWLRALAVHTIGELLARELRTLIARARADREAIVREAADAGVGTRLLDPFDMTGGKMTETLKTLGTMERVLFLRQVPLFGNLTPEDLQQVAEIATERVFPSGEYLCREGEIGDELFVIVEGQVRVTKAANGTEHTLRTLREGEHIGELAILREQPRSANVVAEGGDVRVLMLRGDALKAILGERPEVAMAMLASLADRLSTLA